MILNMYDTNDNSSINKLKKTKGIKLIRKYLPHIDANKQCYIINTIEEWEEIKDRFPEIVTCRTDTRVGTEIPNVHGTTRSKQYIKNYMQDILQTVKNPYFICLELEKGSNERIYTQGGLVLDVNIGRNIVVGYVGPGFDCGDLTKGQAEHETWCIPWDKNAIKRRDSMDRYRVGKIAQKGYAQTTLKRMAFLIKEYPEKKQEILDSFSKKYEGIEPKLFAKLQEEVLIPLWDRQEELVGDGLQHFGVELNVVENNKLVPFEIETPEIFKTTSKQIKQKYICKRVDKESLLKKYLPDLVKIVLHSENNPSANIAFFENNSVVIEILNQELESENKISERYIIPWNDVLFMRNIDDLSKNRFVKKFIQNNSDNEIINSILNDIVFPLYKRKSELSHDGLRTFCVKVNIEDGKIVPFGISCLEKIVSKDKEQER